MGFDGFGMSLATPSYNQGNDIRNTDPYALQNTWRNCCMPFARRDGIPGVTSNGLVQPVVGYTTWLSPSATQGTSISIPTSALTSADDGNGMPAGSASGAMRFAVSSALGTSWSMGINRADASTFTFWGGRKISTSFDAELLFLPKHMQLVSEGGGDLTTTFQGTYGGSWWPFTHYMGSSEFIRGFFHAMRVSPGAYMQYGGNMFFRFCK